MKYKNTKTGAVIDVKSPIHGEEWQELEPAKEPERKTAASQRKKRTEKNE